MDGSSGGGDGTDPDSGIANPDAGTDMQGATGDLGATSDMGPAGDLGPPPPLETEITGQPDEWTNTPNPELRFSSPRPAATFECRVDDAPWAACASPWAIGPLAEERLYTVAVRAIDGDAVDETPAEATFTLDVTPPTLQLEGGPTGDRSAEFVVTADGQTTARCQLDGAVMAPCPGTITLAGLGEGPRAFVAVASDRAGNEVNARHDWVIAAETAEIPGPTERRFALLRKNAQYVLDPDGGAHLLYGYQQLLYQRGRPWLEAPEVVADVPVRAERALAIDAAGHPHAVYLNQVDFTLRYAWRDAEGRWQSEDTGLVDDFNARRRGADALALVVAPDGVPHLVFYMQTAGRNLLHAWRTADGWVTQPVRAGEGNDEQIGLIVGPEGRLWVVWCDGSGGGTWFLASWLNPADPESGWTPEALPQLAGNCRDRDPPVVLRRTPEGHISAVLGRFAGVRDAVEGWSFSRIPDLWEPFFAALEWPAEGESPVGWAMSVHPDAGQALLRWTWLDGVAEVERSRTRVDFPRGGAIFEIEAGPAGMWALQGDDVSATEYPLGASAALPREGTVVDRGWAISLDGARLYAQPDGAVALLAKVAGGGLGEGGPWWTFATNDWTPSPGPEAAQAIVGDDGHVYGYTIGRRAQVTVSRGLEWATLEAAAGTVASVHVDADGRIAALFDEPAILVVAPTEPGGEALVRPLPLPADPEARCPGMLRGGEAGGWVVVRQCQSGGAPFEALRWTGAEWQALPVPEISAYLQHAQARGGRIVASGCEADGGPVLVAWRDGEAQVIRPPVPPGDELIMECSGAIRPPFALSGDGRIHMALVTEKHTDAPSADPFGERLDAATTWLHIERSDSWHTEPLGNGRLTPVIGMDATGSAWVLWQDERQNRIRAIRR